MYIYKVYQNQEVVYIGKTINLKRRMSSHRNKSEWWKIKTNVKFAKVDNKTLMDIYEIILINKYTPTFNKQDNRGDDVSSIDMPNLTFKDLDEDNLPTKNNTIGYKIERNDFCSGFKDENCENFIESNQLLIDGKYTCTLSEQKILFLMLNNWYKKKSPILYSSYFVHSLSREGNKQGYLYSVLKDNYFKLKDLKINGYLVFNSIEKFGEEGYKYEFSEVFKRELGENNRIVIDLNFLKLTTSYQTVRLYYLIKSKRNLNILYLKEIFTFNDSQYRRLRNFKVKFLEPALAQIEKIKNERLSFLQIKQGRKIVSLDFDV